MMRDTKQRIRIRPLHEELKALGILEQDQEEPAPEPNPEGGYADVEQDDEPTDEPDTTTEQDDSEPEDDEEGEAEVEAVNAVKTLSKHFLGVHEQDEPPVAPEEEDDDEEPEEPGAPPMGESRVRRLRRLAEGRFSSRPQRAPVRRSGSGRIASLLEDVSTIVGDIHRVRRTEQIQGFARIALISKVLGERFHKWGMALKEGKLYRVGDVMQRLHEQAADVAIGLDTPPGEEPEKPGDEKTPPAAEQEGGDSSVDELFKKFMAKLLDALQLYNDVTGKSGEKGEQDDLPEPPAEEDDDEPDEEPGKGPPPAAGPPAEEDDDEEPPEAQPEQEEPPTDDDEEGCPECKEDDEDPTKPPSDDDDAVTEARRVLSSMRRKLTGRVESKGKKGKRVLKSARAKRLTSKMEKKGKKR